MKPFVFAEAVSIGGSLRVWLVFILGLLLALLLMIWTPAHAKATSPTLQLAPLNEIPHSVDIKANEASLDVFLKALFWNTGIDIEISDSVKGVVTGTFKGSIWDVLDALALDFGLVATTKEGVIEITSPRAPSKPAIANLSESRNLNLNTPIEKLQGPLGTDESHSGEQGALDPVVERVFVLKNAVAIDTRRQENRYAVVPGVVTQLIGLVDKLGIASLNYVNAPETTKIEISDRVSALPSMNAIIVKDLASRMALCEDLIKSLDIAPSTVPNVTSELSNRHGLDKWHVVR